MMYLKNHDAEKADALEIFLFHDPMYLNHTSISMVSFCPRSSSFCLNKHFFQITVEQKEQIEK